MVSDETETVGATAGAVGDGPGVTVAVGTIAVNVAACKVWTASVSASSRLTETGSSVVAGSFDGDWVTLGEALGRLQASAAIKRILNAMMVLLMFLMVLLVARLSHKYASHLSQIWAIERVILSDSEESLFFV